MNALRAILHRLSTALRGGTGRNLAICAAGALLLALLLRFGVTSFMGGGDMAVYATGGAPAAKARSAIASGTAGNAAGQGGDAATNPAGITTGADGKLAEAPPGSNLSQGAGPGAANRSQTADSFKRSIIPRSLFDSTQVDVEPDDEGPEGPLDFDPLADCAKSTMSLELMVTMEAVPMDRGAALVKGGDESDDRGRVYQVGDTVSEGATLWAVYRRKVMLLRNDGNVECLTIGEEAPRKRKAAKPGDAKAAGDDKESALDGITKTGENEYDIDGDAIDWAKQNIDKLSRDARITQYYREGQRSGFRLSSIRRNGVFGKLGFRNNDVITNVNGNAITSTQEALKIYESLASEGSFNIEVLRRGQPTTLKYSVN